MGSNIIKSSAFIFSSKRAYRKISNLRCISLASKFAANTTVDAEEVKKFESISNEWWDNKHLLHSLNATRVPFVRDGLLSVDKRFKKVSNPLEGYNILDVGCGGGILSEPLARLGAKVTGLDPGLQNIQVATEHASNNPEIRDRLNYICDTVENLASSSVKYDSVVCSEVVEHVINVQTFVHSCVELTKNNGSLFFTTINQTNLSYFLSILMAEYVLGLIPRGTHEWNKFVKPEDLIQILESLNCTVLSVEGVMYNPITKKFSWCQSSANMYALHAVKQ